MTGQLNSDSSRGSLNYRRTLPAATGGLVGALVLACTVSLMTGCAAYQYQHSKREVPEEVMSALSSAEMVSLGREIVHGRGRCFKCHRIGDTGTGTRGPDLAGIGLRAQTRIDGMTAIEYLAQSLYDPDAFVVPNYRLSMSPANEPPANLTDEEILLAVAYLQSLGGEPTVSAATALQPGAE